MPGQSPTVRRRRLGNELRRLRENAGLTIEQVAKRLECSGSKVSRIETAQVSATTRDVRDMVELYGVTGRERDGLIQIAREARRKGWWYPYSDLPVATYVGLEAEATSTRMYTGFLVPGLLQTPDYAREALHAIRPDLGPEEIERRVEVRMARQPLLTQDDPLTLWAVLDEGALRRVIGGQEVMRQQLLRLVEATALPNVTLQVLPFSAGAHAGLDGPFTIIGFREPADHDVVFMENTMSDLYLEESDEIRRYSMLFEHICAAADKPDDSAAFFAMVAEEL
jgi:transcriptional regulator with XRE-family HTH domain